MISRRGLEAGTAALTGAFGAAVLASSLDNGIGWSSAGVEAGAFPFLMGALILAGSLFNLASGWRTGRDTAIGRRDLKRVGALFLPSVVYVAAIPLIGMYVASTAYVFGTLVVQTRMSAPRAGAMALATSVALYLLFERLFLIGLPRGVLGDALGF